MERERDWYDDPNILTTVIALILGLILILSQTYAIRNHLGLWYMIRSLINYSSVYVILLAYFILLKTKVGKRYFVLMNIILGFMFAILSLGSIFSMIQFFKLETIFTFLQNTLVFFYFVKVLWRDTKLYSMFGFSKIPFDKVTNDYYFYGISALFILGMILSFVDRPPFDSFVLLLLQTLFFIGFVRYLYLYQEYCEEFALDSDQEEVEESVPVKVGRPKASTSRVVKSSSSKKSSTTKKSTSTKTRKKGDLNEK